MSAGMGSPDPDEWVYTRWYPCHAGFVHIARRGIREFAARCGYAGKDLDDVENAVGEAVTNAIEHRSHPEQGVTVTARRIPNGITIEVRDQGRGFEASLLERNRRKLAPRGYGIRIMTASMNAVEFADNGRCVRLTKYLDRSLPE